MIWFFAEDIDYYQDLPTLMEKYDLDEIDIFPSIEDIKSKISNKKSAFIAPALPPKDIRGLFVVVELENKFGVLTTQEKAAGITEQAALEMRLGLSVIDSPFTLDDVAGGEKLKEWAELFLVAEKKGYRAKGIFLVGVPGTGKTFFPKCFAGHTGRMLIMLNLSLIIDSAEPIRTMDKVFEYLSRRYRENTNEKYVILIDEIEKMIGTGTAIERRVTGRLMTILNDMHTSAAEYAFDGIFFATANSLNVFLDNEPALLRRGRWDELFFVNLPDEKMARDVFMLYLKKFRLESILSLWDLDDLMAEIEASYQRDNNQADKFPYTASEIETFCKRLDFIRMARGNLKKTDIEDTVKMIIPITKSAGQGIDRITAQRELFIEV